MVLILLSFSVVETLLRGMLWVSLQIFMKGVFPRSSDAISSLAFMREAFSRRLECHFKSLLPKIIEAHDVTMFRPTSCVGSLQNLGQVLVLRMRKVVGKVGSPN